MRRVVSALLLGAASLGGAALAAPAQAAGQLCVEIHLNVNGTPVDHAQCEAIPDLPTAP